MNKLYKALLIIFIDPIMWIFLIILPGVIAYHAYEKENEFLIQVSFMLVVTLMILGTFALTIRNNKKRIQEKKKLIQEKKKN